MSTTLFILLANTFEDGEKEHVVCMCIPSQ